MRTLPIRLLNDRRDQRTARIVDDAIELKKKRGPKAAAKFLTAYGAAFRLTVRVLSGPRR